MNHTHMIINSTTQPNTSRSPTYQSQAITIVQVTLLAILGFIIVLGNLSSIVTFLKTQSLRRRCHYLIISLAFADFLVGVVVFMAVYYFLALPLSNKQFIHSLEIFDSFTGNASILTLAVIALERFLAICFPFRHRMLSFKFYIICVALPWLGSLMVSSFYLTGVLLNNSVFFRVYNYSLSIFALIALIFITFLYVCICLKINKKNAIAQHQNRATRERKLAVTLLIVTLSSLLTWLPHQFFVSVRFVFEVKIVAYSDVLFTMTFLKFVNSGINVFIYVTRMSEFRQAFLALFNNNVWQQRTEGESFQTSVLDGSINSDRVGNDMPRNVNQDSATAPERNEVDIMQSTQLKYENNETNPMLSQIKELVTEAKQEEPQESIGASYDKHGGLMNCGFSDINETKF